MSTRTGTTGESEGDIDEPGTEDPGIAVYHLGNSAGQGEFGIDNPLAGSAGMSAVEREQRIRQLESDIERLDNLEELERRVNKMANVLISIENRIERIENTLQSILSQGNAISGIYDAMSHNPAVAFAPRGISYSIAIIFSSVGIFLGNLPLVVGGGLLLVILGIHFKNAPNIN